MSHRYGRARVLESFDWVVPSGRTALLGPNGAGKSTLLAIGASGLRPRGGHVAIDSVTWPSRRGVRSYRAHVGWMPQQNEFAPHLTVRENVELAAWLKAVPVQQRRSAVGEALEQANLSGRSDDVARRLSGGQQRRLCFAQAIVHRPTVLLLDEPTVGLDPAQREGLRAVLAGVEGADIVISTHQVDDIDEAFDTVVVLHQGRIRFQGSTEQFLGLVEPGDRRGERAYLALAPDVNA
ncbi:ATP-binding cassette domain-containing protein [Actinotalea subterranea]|uniref:ATP-binding cassette domain-containing protein n=1 Tax=Actinotalea subterranea TaxID=2607497 RepID=UPI00165DA50C|nr:ATP-binding cassette domain-containing protein [Actinotalea subterranea]